jgi:putative aminopeptidase FrvX
MSTPDLLHRLLTAPGPSGHEGAPAAIWREAASVFADVSTDTLGSSVARVGGTGEGPLLAIVGHVDEIGLMVTHVDDSGYLFFAGVGGWDPQILVGQRVEVLARHGSVLGVIGRKPIHLLKEEERKKIVEIKELHIDIGARDGEEARGSVRVGDVAVLAADPLDLPNRRLVSRSLDNRLGAYIAAEAIRLVAEGGGAPGDVAAVAAVQEETSFAGSRTVAYSLRPGVAIAVDVTFATDTPGIDERQEGKHELGSGPVLERGTIINPRVFELLHETAEQEGIPFTISASSRNTGTDADAIHLSRAGVPTGVVSVPLRYMHSPVEMVQLDDVDAAARLLAAFARRLGPGVDFRR